MYLFFVVITIKLRPLFLLGFLRNLSINVTVRNIGSEIFNESTRISCSQSAIHVLEYLVLLDCPFAIVHLLLALFTLSQVTMVGWKPHRLTMKEFQIYLKGTSRGFSWRWTKCGRKGSAIKYIYANIFAILWEINKKMYGDIKRIVSIITTYPLHHPHIHLGAG